MATIVEHKETKIRYVLLGTGLGMASKLQKSQGFVGATKTTEEMITSVVSVCNDDGKISRINTSELTVISVGGVSPESILLS